MNRIKRIVQKHSAVFFSLTFSAAVMIIVLALSAYMYSQYYQTMYNDFLRLNEIELNAIESKHENEIRVIRSMVSYISLSDNITCFYLEKQPQKSVELQKRLRQFKSVNEFVSQIFYFYRSDHYLYNTDTSVEVEHFFKVGMFPETTDSGQISKILYGDGNKITILPEQPYGGYLSGGAAEKTVISVPVPPDYASCMFFFVDDTYYDELLMPPDSALTNCYIIYDGEIIAGRGLLSIDQEEVLQVVSEGMALHEKHTFEKQKYLVSMKQSESGFVYCTVQSMEVLNDKIIRNQRKIVTVILTCVVITGAVVAFLFRKILQNIRNFNLLINEEEKEYYNVGKIREGIQTMLVARQENQTDSDAYRKAAFIRNFINGSYTEEKEWRLAVTEAGIRVQPSAYIVIILGRKSASANNACDRILEMVQRADEVDGYGVKLINSCNICFVLFGGSDGSFPAIISGMCEIIDKCGEHSILAVSNPHSSYAEVSEAYFEATTAFDNRFLNNRSEVLWFSQLPDVRQVDRISVNYIRQLGTAIRAGDMEEMEWIMNEICSQLQRENCSLLSFKLLYNEISNLLLTLANERKQNFLEISSIFSLSKCLTLQDFKDNLLKICRALVYTADSAASEPSVMQEIAAYMKEHYSNPDLNMAHVAEYFDISANQLSVEFKRQQGISPSDYLRNIRMKKAKKLLTETDMKLKDICSAVGYEEERVFIRTFKNDTGKTPTQYRSEANS